MFSRKRFIILITLILLGTLLLDNAKPKIVNAIIPSSWTKTGEPIGGLSYDVRYGASSDGILDTSVMYVTDNYSGVNKSTGGITWDTTHINHGLTDLYIGSLVMHPTNPNILLAGAGNNSCSYLPDGSSTGGVFLSENGGET